MVSTVTYWRILRVLRWLCWIGALGYYLEFLMNTSAHMNSFGHLYPVAEFWMFGLPLAATFIGFAELMMRGRAGVPQPAFGRNW